MNEPDPLEEIAERITDERSVDWDREASAHPETKRLLRRLESLEKLAAFQRRSRGLDPEIAPPLFTWGSLRVLEALGEGAFAEVFRAWDPTLRREVALKLRKAAHQDREAGTREWVEEARRLARIRHPHVVSVHGADVHGGRAGIWMERVNGKTLEAVLADHGALGAREAQGVGIELCAALAAVHAAGIVHGDLKTTNVMRELGGRIVLMDFGAGSMLQPDRGHAPVAFATPLVSAPEVLQGVGARAESDLYALGVLLYRLVSGRYPVEGTTEEEVRRRLERGETVPLRDVRPDLPHAFIQVISRALEHRPEDRYASAGAMEAALARSLGEGEGHAPAKATVPAASIAVLPLVNVSEDGSGDYFADGLAEEFLDHLARIRGLRVAARSSSFQFKGRSEDLREVGRKLNVETILEGSVRRSGDRVRISVQLVHATDGLHLWSQRYDRELRDVFAVQDEIGRSVAAALRVALQRTVASRPAPVAPATYDAFLLGRYFHRRGKKEDLDRASGYLEKAVQADPGFAPAWAGLALVRNRQAGHGHAALEEGYRKAREAAEQALALDPDLPDAHTALGQIRLIHDWDWKGADTAFRSAMALDPGHAGCIANAAMLATVLGRIDEALELGRRACELDPLSVTACSNLGLFAWYAGRDEEAIAQYRKALELDPSFPLTHAKLGRVFLTARRLEEAMGEMEAERVEAFRTQGLAMVYHVLERHEESRALLEELTERHGKAGAFQIAEACAFLNDRDRAFEWLDRAFEQRDPGLVTIQGRPLLRNLERDPRWRSLLEKLRLAP